MHRAGVPVFVSSVDGDSSCLLLRSSAAEALRCSIAIGRLPYGAINWSERWNCVCELPFQGKWFVEGVQCSGSMLTLGFGRREDRVEVGLIVGLPCGEDLSRSGCYGGSRGQSHSFLWCSPVTCYAGIVLGILVLKDGVR